ncbi:MAG: DnaJ-class molecular chaperone with C-terminal Zn finger domain [Saliniramus fredricksonii]|uniref:DnaJ domain-containing protein n=1 Tax=Saliniramus fredricksonii TaxID=1653334 RepID=A0A0P7YBD4_9HYPH|nr:J domain-containing protein [Saliniramus fredricksonii]KPQ11344.1 MAG: DnaJ-class molecular chaperone with C-terminal Zn finger domain [Saliniramus fredricksonii]SCC82006.1 DnaJ domain-containing protein [Saliniramus fredricksonii]
MRDPYDILGVSRSASEAEIKSAFRKLAKKWHPDQNKDAKAASRFAEINSAYELLGDAEKRGQFDRGEIDAEGKPRFSGFGAGGGRRYEGFEGFDFDPAAAARGRGGAWRSGPGAGGGGGAEDIFSQLFGDAFRQAGRGPNPFQQAGQAGARSGAAGRGAGKGADINASLSVTLEDIAAGAKKRILLPNDREVEVNLPKGVSDGQTIRLRGLGGENPIGEPGDVLLRIDIIPHEKFTVEGDNLRHRLPVPLEDAILGATLRVPTLTGAVEMKIPPMSSSGRTFRMRGKGLPGKKQTGDLLVTLEIRLPDEADEALTEFARRRRAAKAA